MPLEAVPATLLLPSLINTIILPALGEVVQCELDHFRCGLGDPTGGSSSFPVSLSSHSELLCCQKMQLFPSGLRRTSCHAFGEGHALGQTFHGESFAAHFDVDEERGGGQAGTIGL